MKQEDACFKRKSLSSSLFLICTASAIKSIANLEKCNGMEVQDGYHKTSPNFMNENMNAPYPVHSLIKRFEQSG